MAIRVLKSHNASFEDNLPLLVGLIKGEMNYYNPATIEEITKLPTGRVTKMLTVPTCKQFPNGKVEPGKRCKILRTDKEFTTIAIPGVPCKIHVTPDKVEEI